MSYLFEAALTTDFANLAWTVSDLVSLITSQTSASG